MWKKIYIQTKDIHMATDRAALIKLPKKSIYRDYKFWWGGSLIIKDKFSHQWILSYKDEFDVKLIKDKNKDDYLMFKASEIMSFFDHVIPYGKINLTN
jgi:hypothetical protein